MPRVQTITALATVGPRSCQKTVILVKSRSRWISGAMNTKVLLGYPKGTVPENATREIWRGMGVSSGHICIRDAHWHGLVLTLRGFRHLKTARRVYHRPPHQPKLRYIMRKGPLSIPPTSDTSIWGCLATSRPLYVAREVIAASWMRVKNRSFRAPPNPPRAPLMAPRGPKAPHHRA